MSQEKVQVYDRDGRVYEMSHDEARLAIASGAYTSDRNIPPMTHTVNNVQGGKMSNGKVKVREKASGIVFPMLVIDAREAVKTGFFERVEEEQAPATAVVPTPQSTPEPKQKEQHVETVQQPEPEQPAEDPVTMYPSLSKQNTRKEIMEVLRAYGVQHRQNMNEDTLLGLWQTFLDERAAEESNQ